MKKKKSAIIYKSGEDDIVIETGEEFPYGMETFTSKSVVKDITVGTGNVLYIHFQNEAMLMFCNVPFEYFEMPEGEEDENLL